MTWSRLQVKKYRDAMSDDLSIGDVSLRTGLSVDTLRFYEREGLLPRPHRNAAGRRIYDEDDIEWISICRRLRASSMPVPEIARYADLVRAGSGNEPQRLEILQQHEARVRAEMAALQEALELIEFKVTAYTKAVQEGNADRLFVRSSDDDALLASRDEKH